MKYILVLLSFFISFSANASSKDVNVVNTPDVNVANTPQVDARQSGDWSVNINGQPGVTIENGSSEPVPVDITHQPSTGELVNIALSGEFVDGAKRLDQDPREVDPPLYYQVPDGKEFIAKHISCVINGLEVGSQVKLELDTTLQNQDQNAYRENTSQSGDWYPIYVQKSFSDGVYDDFEANQSMLFVVGGPTNNGFVSLYGIRSETLNNAYVSCALTGVLKNL